MAMHAPVARLLATAVLAVTAFNASAALVTTRVGLGGNDFIDWSQLGPDGTNVADPANVTTDLGLIGSVNNPNGGLERRTQGSSWSGNFAPGDALLFTLFAPGPISIDFGTGLDAIGAQIQRNTFGAFVASISVFDAGNNLLESYLVNGNSTSAGDNSAIFVGISRGGLNDIDRVEFNVTNNSDFSINQVDLISGGGRVPEPGTLALMGLSLLALAAGRRRKS